MCDLSRQKSGRKPRGLASALLPEQGFGQVYPAENGYLLTARGNPYGNVVKKGSKVILHSASGVDFEVPVLKQIARDGTWKSKNAKVAMGSVGKHMESMECYGCHITVDLETAFGQTIPGITQMQSQAVPKLDHDLSKIVTREGEELVTIGSHWPLTGPPARIAAFVRQL